MLDTWDQAVGLIKHRPFCTHSTDIGVDIGAGEGYTYSLSRVITKGWTLGGWIGIDTGDLAKISGYIVMLSRVCILSRTDLALQASWFLRLVYRHYNNWRAGWHYWEVR